MVHCSVSSCKSDSGKKVPHLSFHSFPENDDLRLLWIKATGRKDWEPNKFSTICSKHFDENLLVKKKQRTYLFPKAVPRLTSEESNAFPTAPTSAIDLETYKSTPPKKTLAQNVNGNQIKTVIQEAVKMAESSLKTSTAAPIPPLKVQFKDTSAQRVSTRSDSNNTHPTTLTPLVIVDIPPAADQPVPPVIEEKSFFNAIKETRLRNRCTFLEKQIRAWKQKVRRRVAIIDKLEAEKKELTAQHLRTVELLKGGDKTDPKFEHTLYKAVMKLS